MDVLIGTLGIGANTNFTVSGANTTSTKWANGGEVYLEECTPVITITTNNVNVENVSGFIQDFEIIIYSDGTI